MTAADQSAGNARDSEVVEEICGYVTGIPPKNFFLFAGAGSGKTRTLVEVLRRITGVEKHQSGGTYAQNLRARGQCVRVITYTTNAAMVAAGRLGDNDLTRVSTIHAFCWELVAGFDDDIRDALLAKHAEDLIEAKKYALGKKNGETETDRRKYAEIELAAEEVRATEVFRYTPDRNTYGLGALSHNDVLWVTAWLLEERPTLRRIVQDRHPLVLVDESQDTLQRVLDALFAMALAKPGEFTLGLVGDHRQRIYPDGHQDLPSQVPVDWARPKLQMNHRSQERIVTLINTIWDADIEGRTQPKTGVKQHAREEKNGGIVRIFIGDTSMPEVDKIQMEAECATVMADATGVAAWLPENRDFKTLALEHKLAAKRGGFAEAYSGLELMDKDAVTPKGNGDRTGPSMVRPLLGPVLELLGCVGSDGTLNEFSAVGVLRRHGALAQMPETATELAAALADVEANAMRLAALAQDPNSTVRDVAQCVVDAGWFKTDDRLIAALADAGAPPPEPATKTKEDKDDRRRRGWHMFLASPWHQVPRYRAYLSGEAPLATHQVVKGSEFKHVMVVMDDEDAGGFLFSYDKFFGAKALSATDNANAAAGNETTIDRTLRLLYVTCSRAEESLALVLWAVDPDAAQAAVERSGWFRPGESIRLRAGGARSSS